MPRLRAASARSPASFTLGSVQALDDAHLRADVIRFFGAPFPTRMTIVRLSSGKLFVHSPTAYSPALAERVAELGPVAHLVSPNWILHGRSKTLILTDLIENFARKKSRGRFACWGAWRGSSTPTAGHLWTCG